MPISFVAGCIQSLAHPGLLRYVQFSSPELHPEDNKLVGPRDEDNMRSAEAFIEGREFRHAFDSLHDWMVSTECAVGVIPCSRSVISIALKMRQMFRTLHFIIS